MRHAAGHEEDAMARPQKLEESAIREALASLPGWTYAGGKLHRELRFASFVQAFGFMSSAALVAEAMNHHPEWSNVYSRVVIDLVTHDAQGVTSLDLELARRMNELASAARQT
jgi:4a-hydroxytetrahydrobiopterin dehydratase